MENNRLIQTKFDSMVTDRNMQLTKAVIPYIDSKVGSILGIYIKLRELENASHVNSKITVSAMDNNNNNKIKNLLEDIREFLSDEEKEIMDTIITVMEMANMDDETRQDMMGNYMNILGI